MHTATEKLTGTKGKTNKQNKWKGIVIKGIFLTVTIFGVSDFFGTSYLLL